MSKTRCPDHIAPIHVVLPVSVVRVQLHDDRLRAQDVVGRGGAWGTITMVGPPRWRDNGIATTLPLHKEFDTLSNSGACLKGTVE